LRSPPSIRFACLRVDRERWKRELEQLGEEAALKGTISSGGGGEGINRTISGTPSGVQRLMAELRAQTRV